MKKPTAKIDYSRNRRLSYYLDDSARKGFPEIIIFFTFILVVIRLQRKWWERKLGEKARALRILLFKNGEDGSNFDDTIARNPVLNKELHAQLIKRDNFNDAYYLELEKKCTFKGIISETEWYPDTSLFQLKKKILVISR